MHQRTFFMLLKATPHWHALDAAAQRAVFDDALALVFNGYPELRMGRYQAAAFHGRCSHVLMWELRACADEAEYASAVDALHARPFFGTPLFDIVDVIAAVEDDDEEVSPLVAIAI